MATKKVVTKSDTKTGISKVAEKIAFIAGTIVGKKNQLVKKAGTAINTVKSKVHDLTAPPQKVTKKATTAVKKTAKKVKGATKKAAKKVASVKKNAATATRQVKKIAKKAAKK